MLKLMLVSGRCLRRKAKSKYGAYPSLISARGADWPSRKKCSKEERSKSYDMKRAQA